MRISYLHCALGALVLAACLGGGDDGKIIGTGGNVTINTAIEVLDIDRDAGTITLKISSYECDDSGQSVLEVDTTVNRYAIKDGKLILWSEEECEATILEGTSTDIVGVWTGKGAEMDSPIPEEFRPAQCVGIPVDSTETDVLGDLSATYTVYENRIEVNLAGTVCMGETMAASMVEEGFTVESKSCNTVTLRDPEGGIMTVNASMSSSAMSVSFSYKGKTCKLDMDIPAPGKPIDCARQQAALDNYIQCVQGFAGPIPVEKAAAAAKRAASAIHP